jgi:hypothetical protein
VAEARLALERLAGLPERLHQLPGCRLRLGLEEHCVLELGRLALAAGHRDEARDHLVRARDLFRSMGVKRWLAETVVLRAGLSPL